MISGGTKKLGWRAQLGKGCAHQIVRTSKISFFAPPRIDTYVGIQIFVSYENYIVTYIFRKFIFDVPRFYYCIFDCKFLHCFELGMIVLWIPVIPGPPFAHVC